MAGGTSGNNVEKHRMSAIPHGTDGRSMPVNMTANGTSNQMIQSTNPSQMYQAEPATQSFPVPQPIYHESEGQPIPPGFQNQFQIHAQAQEEEYVRNSYRRYPAPPHLSSSPPSSGYGYPRSDRTAPHEPSTRVNQEFPSPHPTGTGVPTSATSDMSGTRSAESHYATPQSGGFGGVSPVYRYGERREGYEGEDGRNEGMPGNPRLY
jgi:hypothetical protein